MAKQAELPQVAPNLLNAITPQGLKFNRSYLEIGENKARVYGIVRYPSEPDIGWIARLNNIASTICCETYEPINPSEFINAISRDIRQNRALAEYSRDPLEVSRAIKSAEDGEKMMLDIDQNGESLGNISTLVMPLAREDEAFVNQARKVETSFTSVRANGRTLALLQKQAFETMSPYHGINKKVADVTNRIAPIRTFVGGFPFASQSFSDNKGYYFAKDASDGIVSLDLWKRGGDRTNSNIICMGVAGVGKSTAIKHIALAEYMKSTKIIFIDPEREYKELTQNLNGDWINASGGQGAMINPLQIKTPPMDEEDDKEKMYTEGMGALALHITTLEVFFSLLFPDLSDIQRALLNASVEELYKNFGIVWDTDVSDFKPNQFPVFEDLYNLLVEKSKNDSKKEQYDTLACLLRDVAIGSKHQAWNGHTTLNPRTRCICLDTLDLQNSDERVKKTQYFNLLTWCWEQMSRDRNERVMLFCDEAYLLIDPKVPQSLIFLRNAVKRARKYEAALAIISHSVVDFLDPSIKMYGQALMDIPCFKILMGTDGKNLKETEELYDLTEAQVELLAGKRRKKALLMVGSKRINITFDIPEYKFKYIGTAGGR